MTFNKTLFSEIVKVLTHVWRNWEPITNPTADKWNKLLSQVKKEEFSDLSSSIIIYEPDRNLDSFPKGCALTIIASLVSFHKAPMQFFDYETRLPIDPYNLESSIGCFMRIWNTNAISNHEDIEEAIKLLNDKSKPVLIIADRDYICHQFNYHNIHVLHSFKF